MNRLSLHSGLVTASLATLLMPAFSLAHGVAYREFQVGTGIEATYDDGLPMSFCDVSVFSPTDSGTPYQSGETDPQGCLAFVPNTNGLWKVTVDDGMGHVMTAEVRVDPTRSGAPVPSHKLNRGLRAMIGFSLIFGLFGIYILARQATGRDGGKPGCGGKDCACTSPKA